MSNDSIDISQINTNFDENTEPLDRHFLEILKAAYKGDVHCRRAIVDFDLVVPFSDFVPKISDDFRKYFEKQFRAGTPLKLYLYQKDGKLIMSDDYVAYYYYKELKIPTVPCVIIGFCTPKEGINFMGGPYILKPPTLETIN